MKPNYNSKRSDFRANENHVKINQPLSQEYQDYAKIFLEEGIAYQTAKSMGDIPPHQLRKILDPIKEAVAMIKKTQINLMKHAINYIMLYLLQRTIQDVIPK